MADVVELLGKTLSPVAIGALSRSLGIDEVRAKTLVSAIVPELVERLRDNATGGDSTRIATALNKDHDGSILDTATAFLGGDFRQGPGAGIIRHVFGDEFDAVAGRLATSTGLPQPVVNAAFTALAPIAMGAIAKAAIGAVSAVIVVKLLDVAVDQIRSGKLHSALSGLNRRLDADGDGNAIDDVGRNAVGAARKVVGSLLGAGRKVATNDKVRSATAHGATKAKHLVSNGARVAKRKLGGLFKRFGR